MRESSSRSNQVDDASCDVPEAGPGLSWRGAPPGAWLMRCVAAEIGVVVRA
jgi:hypothetical protein